MATEGTSHNRIPEFKLRINSLLHVESANSSDRSHEASIDKMLRQSWQRIMEAGDVFRYSLDGIQTRVLPGEYKFVVLSNPKRFTHRRVPADFKHIKEPFRSDRFNFNKVGEHEILMKITLFNEEARQVDSALIVVNVSPINFGHVLLVPQPLKELPQIITKDSLTMAIAVVGNSLNNKFCIVVNSLLAFASVNHLHYHGLYLEEDIFVQTIGGKHLSGCCYELLNPPVKGFGFCDSKGNLEILAREAYKAIEILVAREIPHNVLILMGDSFEKRADPVTSIRIVLFPRLPVFGLKTAFDSEHPPLLFAAACELGGFVPILDNREFNKVDESIICSYLKKVSMSEQSFNEIRQEILKTF